MPMFAYEVSSEVPNMELVIGKTKIRIKDGMLFSDKRVNSLTIGGIVLVEEKKKEVAKT